MRFGIVGIGKHGKRYVNHIRNDVEDAFISSVCQRDGKRAKRYLEGLGIKADVHTDYKKMCASDIDSVIIATPTSTHPQIALEALRNGKHLLLEKPMAGSVEECERITETVDEYNCKLMVSQTLRYNPTVMEVKKLAKEMGGVESITMEQHLEPPDRKWLYNPDLASGGVLLNTGVHIFDTIRYISESDIKPLECTTKNILNPNLEDLAFGYFDLGSGGSGGFSTSRYFRGRSRIIKLDCTGGSIAADAMNDIIKINNVGKTNIFRPTGEKRTLIPLIKDFMDSIINGKKPPITGKDGMESVRVADGFYDLIIE